MQLQASPKQSRPTSVAADLAAGILLPAMGTSLLWASSIQTITSLQAFLAWILLCIPSCTYLRWKRSPGGEFPLFSLIALMYWFAYGLPLFWGEGVIWSFDRTVTLSSESLSSTLIMVLLGLASLAAGMACRIGRKWRPSRTIDLRPEHNSWRYVLAVLLISLPASLYPNLVWSLGGSFRQALYLLVKYVPKVMLVLLFRKVLLGRSNTLEKLAVVGYCIAGGALGVASGWMGAAAGIIVIMAVVYLQARARVPKIVVVVLVLYIAFFQIGKEEFRKMYWQQAVESTPVERVEYWIGASLSQWQWFFEQPEAHKLRTLLTPTFMRLSLLEQSANVMELTPNLVPHQGGWLYEFLAVSLIPRAIWPEKPTINEANRFYQVAYGLTEADDLEGVSIAVGFLAESYITFGWAGIVGVMFLMGILLDVLQSILFDPKMGALMNAIGVAMVPGFMAIEHQMAQYLGGMAQFIFLVILVMLPFVRLVRYDRPAKHAPQGVAAPQPAMATQAG